MNEDLDHIELTTESEEDTKRLAKELAKALRPGDVISLTGDLGAGKTRFVQGLAEGLGVDEAVTSPTFTIIKEYLGGRLDLYHFDAYRLAGPADLVPLGYEDYFYGSGVTVIEWGNRVESALPDDHLTIELHRELESPARRRLVITARGPRAQRLRKELTAAR